MGTLRQGSPVEVGNIDLSTLSSVSTKVKGLHEGWYSVGLLLDGVAVKDPPYETYKEFFGNAKIEVTVTTSLGARIVDVTAGKENVCGFNSDGLSLQSNYIVFIPSPTCDSEEGVHGMNGDFFLAKSYLSYRIKCRVLRTTGGSAQKQVIVQLRPQQNSFYGSVMKNMGNG